MTGFAGDLKISIVLCTYNGEKYLAEQLQTLTGQTLPFYELIICDDASTDSTPAIIQRFAKTDSRVKIFQNKNNLGFNKNFETAIRHSSGNWIAPADQDDIWELNKLVSMVKDIQQGVTLVHCNSAKFSGTDISTKKIYPRYQKFSGNDARQLFLYNTIEGHAMLMHRSVVDISFPIPENIYFDWWLGFNAALHGRVVWNKNYLVSRRMHESNASEKQMGNLRKDKGQLNQALNYTRHFIKASLLNEQAAGFGKKLSQKIELAISGKKRPLFFFMLRNRNLVYYYKPNKLLGVFSRVKAILRFLKT